MDYRHVSTVALIMMHGLLARDTVAATAEVARKAFELADAFEAERQRRNEAATAAAMAAAGGGQ